MKRTIVRRIDYPQSSVVMPAHEIDLSLVAQAAAIETLQIDLVARGWIGLFDALLQPASATNALVWRQSGPGGEAEIKRAYSALFGRFFGRAILRHEHHCQNLRQVSDGLSIAPGYSVRRRPHASAEGDLPDWIGWNGQRNCWSVCEAKGSYARSDWRSRRPPVVARAMTQIGRVEVIDPSGLQVQTKDWAVASRWGTVDNGREPVIMTEDPLSKGRELSQLEAQFCARHAHAQFVADLVQGMGRDELAELLRRPDGQAAAAVDRDISVLGKHEGYAAVLLDGGSILPLTGGQRRQRLDAIRSMASELGRKTAVVLVSRTTALRAVHREPSPEDLETVITDDGLTVTSDGVTFSLNPDALELPLDG